MSGIGEISLTIALGGLTGGASTIAEGLLFDSGVLTAGSIASGVLSGGVGAGVGQGVGKLVGDGIGGQIVGGVAGSLAGYGVNKLMRKGMKKYNERQEQEARNLEERKRLISSGGNEIRGPEELGGGTLNRLTGQRMKPPENRRVRQTNMILEGVQNIARQKVRDFEQNVRSSMGKIQSGLAETGQKIKTGLIESGLKMT